MRPLGASSQNRSSITSACSIGQSKSVQLQEETSELQSQIAEVWIQDGCRASALSAAVDV